jgi:iron complex transport system substrate-binding protein
MTRLLAVAFAVLLALSLSCSKAKKAPAVAARVVSLSPSTTEAMYAIGAQALLVGRSRYCDYPADVEKLPQVGGYVDPNFEVILALHPDLVVGARGPAGADVVAPFERHGIATFFPETESLGEIDLMIEGLGDRTGHADDAARAVTAIDARERAITAAVAGAPRPRVLLVFGVDPVFAAGPGGFADEMVRRAGGTNVVAEGGAYPQLAMERVLALDPDIVLNAAVAESHGAEAIRADAPGWSAVRAVREGRVVAVTDEAVLRPGPRVADGLATLARAIHPEAKVP